MFAHNTPPMEKRFKIHFAEARTGIVLGLDGKHHSSEHPIPEVRCATANEANAICCEFFDKHPWAECWLTDTSKGTEECWRNPDKDAVESYDEWEKEKLAFLQWRSLPWLIRCFAKQPKRKRFNPQHPEDWQTTDA